MLIKDLLAFSVLRLLMVLLYAFLLCCHIYRQLGIWIKKRMNVI